MIEEFRNTIRVDIANFKPNRCKRMRCRQVLGVSDQNVLVLREEDFEVLGHERKWIDDSFTIIGLESLKFEGLYGESSRDRSILFDRMRNGWHVNGWNLRGRAVIAKCVQCKTPRRFAGIQYFFDDEVLWDFLAFNLDRAAFNA